MSTPNMALTEPTVGSSTDAWGTILNAAFNLIDAHDHTTGKGVKVPSAALNINADTSWASGGSNFSLTDVKALDFVPVAATGITTYSSALFANSSDSNNLYYRNSGGTNVKITDGNTLNISIVGGIGGDYASIGALFDYDDASDTYRARQQTAAAVRQYGKMAHADLKLFEYIAAGGAAVPTNSVTLKSPAALAASYTVTLFAALPGSTSVLQCDASGVLTASNTVINDITMTAGKSITISGAGNYKHGTKTISMAITPGMVVVETGSLTTLTTPGIKLANNTICYVRLPPLPQHARVDTVRIYFPNTTDRTNTTCLMYQSSSADPATLAFTTMTITLTNSGTAIKSNTVSQSPTAGQEFFVQLANGVNTPSISAIAVDFSVN